MTAIHHIQIHDDETTGLIRFEVDRAFGLVLLTAARRDLNAMSMAPGASPATRNLYSAYAGLLGRAAAGIPQVDLLRDAEVAATEDPLGDLLG